MDHEWKTLKEQLKQSVLAGIDFSRENSEEELWEKIDEQIVLKAKECAITVEQRIKLRRELFSFYYGDYGQWSTKYFHRTKGKNMPVG